MMELLHLHMQSHRWQTRAPDWMAAAVAGFVAGAALMVLELLWSAAVHPDNPWAITHRIAAITMGRDVLQATGFALPVVAVALLTHYVLGIVFGLVLGALMASFRFDSSNGMVAASGAVFGILVYLFDFYGMVGAFPWFGAMRGWPTLLAHLGFGIVAAFMYWKLERPQRRFERVA